MQSGLTSVTYLWDRRLGACNKSHESVSAQLLTPCYSRKLSYSKLHFSLRLPLSALRTPAHSDMFPLFGHDSASLRSAVLPLRPTFVSTAIADIKGLRDRSGDTLVTQLLIFDGPVLRAIIIARNLNGNSCPCNITSAIARRSDLGWYSPWDSVR